MRFVATPGTATAGQDYVTAPAVGGQGLSSLTSAKGGEVTAYATGRGFRVGAGQASVRVLVRTVDDDRAEPRETFGLDAVAVQPGPALARAAHAGGPGRQGADAPSALAHAEATGTIIDDDVRANALAALLASFGRTLASDAVSVVGERFPGAAARTGVTLGGRELSLDPASASGTAVAGGDGEDWLGGLDRQWDGLSEAGDEDRPSARELLTASSFTLSVGGPEDDLPGGPVGWTIWGRAAASGFSSRPASDLETQGDVLTGFLGADTRVGENLLAGVALARSRADMGYRLKGEDGEVDATMTSAFPYAHWTLREDLDLWAMLGAGSGEARLTDGAGTALTGIGMRMAALGWRRGLGDAGGVSWALKGDGFAVRMESDAVEGLRAVKAGAQRLRLAVEGESLWPLTDSARLRTQFEAGGRWDGGCVGEGYGAEVGASVGYEDPERGIQGEARWRYLLAHQAEGFKERGASLTVRFDPGGDGVGPWVGVSPQWNTPESGVQSLWEDAPRGGGEASPRAARLSLETGWRFDESRALSLAFDRGEEKGLTGRVELLGGALALEAARRETGTAAPEHRIGLELRIPW